MGRQLSPTDMSPPGTPEWKQLITASKIPAMLGLSPWQSPYALWHEMAGLIDPEALEGDHLDWGNDIEDSLVRWWRRKHPGWQTNAGEIAYTDPALPFPNQVTLDRRARRGRRFHIIECKTAADIDTWGEPGDPDAVPAHYQGAGGLEAIDVIEAFLGVEGAYNYCRANVLKYALRAGAKGNTAQDHRKAAWYAERAASLWEQTKETP